MKIVIKISKSTYEEIKRYGLALSPRGEKELEKALKNGTPLPEHHGRLIDADRTLETAWTNFYKHEDVWEKKDNNYLPFGRMYDQNGFECCQQTIVNAPTIIEGSDS